MTSFLTIAQVRVSRAGRRQRLTSAQRTADATEQVEEDAFDAADAAGAAEEGAEGTAQDI